jgi:hypothetical protein
VLATFRESQKLANPTQATHAPAIRLAEQQIVAEIGEPARRPAHENRPIFAHDALGTLNAPLPPIGRETNPREASMRILSRVFVAVLLLGALPSCGGKLAAPTHAQAHHSNAPTSARSDGEDPPDVQGDYYKWQTLYSGSIYALPYGAGSPIQIMDHALTMEPVQLAMASMAARGYVREPDHDYAFTTNASTFSNGYSLVVLSYSKPGVDLTQMSPGVYVVTKAFEVPTIGWRPATQVFAGLVEDSAGILVPRAPEGDDPFFLEGELLDPVTAESRRIGDALDPNHTELYHFDSVTCFAVLVRAVQDALWSWYTSASPERRTQWDECGRQTIAGAAVGGVTAGLRNPAGITPAGVAAGAAWGAGWAYYRYWMSAPRDSAPRP